MLTIAPVRRVALARRPAIRSTPITPGLGNGPGRAPDHDARLCLVIADRGQRQAPVLRRAAYPSHQLAPRGSASGDCGGTTREAMTAAQKTGLWRLWIALSVIWTIASALYRLRKELSPWNVDHLYPQEWIGAVGVIVWPWIATAAFAFGLWVIAGFRRGAVKLGHYQLTASAARRRLPRKVR